MKNIVKRGNMKKFMMLLIVPSMLSMCIALDFRMPITASCGGAAATATFGVSPSATNGFDIGTDQIHVPFPPAFSLTFESIDTLVTLALDIDIRSSRDSIQIWNGATDNEAGSIVILQWNPTSFPADSGELKIGFHLPADTVSEWIDMTERDSISQ